MSEALNKAATVSPKALLVMSLLTGGSAYGGMRLLSDLHEQISPLVPPNNNIKLQLPSPYKKQEQVPGIETTAIGENMNPQQLQLSKDAGGEYDPTWWHPLAAVGVGLPAGFLGTKALYDTYQDHEYNKKIEAAKQQYTNQLALAQSMNGKIASETPKVDALCEAMAIEQEKSAGVIAGVRAVGRGLGHAINFAKTHPKITRLGGFAGSAAGINAIAGNPIGGAASNLYNSTQVGDTPIMTQGPGAGQPLPVTTSPVSDQQAQEIIASRATALVADKVDKYSGRAGSGVKDAWLGLTGLSAVGMLGLLMHNHTKKKEKEQRANYPTNLEYAG